MSDSFFGGLSNAISEVGSNVTKSFADKSAELLGGAADKLYAGVTNKLNIPAAGPQVEASIASGAPALAGAGVRDTMYPTASSGTLNNTPTMGKGTWWQSPGVLIIGGVILVAAVFLKGK